MLTNKVIAGIFSAYTGVLILIGFALVLFLSFFLMEKNFFGGVAVFIIGILIIAVYLGALIVLLDMRDEVIKIRKHLTGDTDDDINVNIDKIAYEQEKIKREEQRKKNEKDWER